MNIRIFESEREVDLAAAQYVAGRINEKPDMVLGLPTGGTPEGMYANLAKMVAEKKVSFKTVTTFNLDEYAYYDGTEPQSYRVFMKDRLFDHIDIPNTSYHLPSLPKGRDAQACCLDYENAIKAAGGIDLMVLGMGGNGHIGFNEPGTPFGIGVHKTELTEKTRSDNSRFFASEADVPTAAITMGIGSIMRCRSIIMLVKGAAKADVLAMALSGPVTQAIPASVLQLHPFITVFADSAAAAGLAARR